MKTSYRKLNQFKFFGLKIFEWKTDYIEHHIDKDDDEDSLYIKLTERELEE